MGINRFVVVFESDQAVYSSGQDVAGFVELFVESIMACRGSYKAGTPRPEREVL